MRIHADGEGMDREIRDMFKDADGEFDDAGRDGYGRFREGFRKEGEDPKNQKVLRESLTKALARGDYLSNDFFKGEAWQNFRDDLSTRFGDAGQLAGDNLEKGLMDGGDFTSFRNRLDNLTREILNAEKQLQREEGRINQERLAKHRDMLAAYAENERRNTAQMDLDFERHVKDRQNAIDRLRESFTEYERDITRLSRGKDTGGRGRNDLIAGFTKLRAEMSRAGIVTHEVDERFGDLTKTLIRSHPRLTAFTTGVDRFGDRFGAAFGKGSRNNFINFAGSVVGGMFKMLNVIPRIAQGFLKISDTFREAFSGAISNGASSLSATMSGLGSVALLAAGGLLALAASAGVILLAVGPAIAALSLLAGIVTAVASSLSFGLLGAVGALGGILLPAAGIVLTLAGAFLSLSDAQKDALKVKVAPLVSAFKDLGRSAAGEIFKKIGDQASRLAPVIRGFTPLARGMGRAIGQIGDYWTRAISGPGFKQFRAELTNFLPGASRRLGIALGNALGGLGGIFRGLIPITSRFLGWLQQITGEFANWANSTRGQVQIKDFFNRAGESAKALGHFAKEAFDFVVQLLDAGKNTGDSIFTKMGDAIQRAGDYLEKNPDALKNWFSDAGDAADSIGQLVTGLMALVDALDNVATRKTVITTFKLIGDAFRALGIVFGTYNHVIGDVASALGKLGDIKLPHIDFSTIGGGAGGATGKIAGVFTGLGPMIARAIGNLGPIIGRKFNDILPFARRVPALVAGVFRVVPNLIASALGGLPGRVGGIFGRLSAPARRAATLVGQGFSGVTGRVVGSLSGIPGRVSGILGRLPGIARSAANAAGGAFSGVLGRIRGFFNGVPGAVSGILNRLGGIASSAAGRAVAAFARVQGGIVGHFSGIPGAVGGVLSRLAGEAASAASAVVGKFSGLAGRIIAAVGHITFPKPTIPMPSIPHISLPTLNWPVHISIPHLPGHAAGTITTGAQIAMIGEDGPEAVVPLNRALSQVDPSVRWLSAIAQGKSLSARDAASAPDSGRKLHIENMTVVTPNADSRAVASEVVNRLMAAAY